MKNLLIGAISGNYSPKDLENWVDTSNWENCDRVLLLLILIFGVMIKIYLILTPVYVILTHHMI